MSKQRFFIYKIDYIKKWIKRDHPKLFSDSAYETSKDYFLIDYFEVIDVGDETRRFEALVDNFHFESQVEHDKGIEKGTYPPLDDGIFFDDLYIKYNTLVINNFFYHFHDKGV